MSSLNYSQFIWNVAKLCATLNLLFQVIQHFSRVNLCPENVTNEQMSNIFEELIRKFAEA